MAKGHGYPLVKCKEKRVGKQIGFNLVVVTTYFDDAWLHRGVGICFVIVTIVPFHYLFTFHINKITNVRENKVL